MLADKVKRWSRELKKEGRQEGLQKGIRAFQDFLLSGITERFGPVPVATRRRIRAVQDLDQLKALGKRLLAAGSLDDLGL
jgi:hypothetical protein